MNGIYLGIGGNEGNRLENIRMAQKKIEERIGRIVKKSSVYRTAAWGLEQQADFYNQVLYVRTKLRATQCLNICLSIEQDMGRVRGKKWESRIMDIDILFYNNDVINQAQLHVPHPHIAERRFVLAPLAEIAAHKTHPILRKKIKTLFNLCTDPLAVKKMNYA